MENQCSKSQTERPTMTPSGMESTRRKIVMALRELMVMCGDDPLRDGVELSPDRFVDAMIEMTSGHRTNPVDQLSTMFDFNPGVQPQPIIVTGVEFVSLCEHHFLPFVGVVSFAYVPRDRVVGLSKIPRLIECFARRFQIQEAMTAQIVNTFSTVIEPVGVAAVVSAHHSCMGCRGVRQPRAKMVTTATAGVISNDVVSELRRSVV